MDFDKDLAARQEARLLCRQAEKAQSLLAQMGQEKLDAIVEAMAKAFSAAAVELAEMAVRETGFGNVEDKITKNRFASETNFGGALLSGTQSACDAACAAFRQAVGEMAGKPLIN